MPIHALLLLLTLIPLAAAQPEPLCSNGNYSAGSTYETNLLDLLRTLRQNASSSPSLFASGALGAAPDTAWALVLCRGDVSASDCYDCVTWASRDAATACNRSMDVALCYDQCYVRLANQDFRDPAGNSGEVHVLSGTHIFISIHIISSDDVDSYHEAVTGLLTATVQYAVDNSSRLFATGQWVGANPFSSNIYSAAQCAADLSPTQCRNCLQGLVGKWPNLFTRFTRDRGNCCGPTHLFYCEMMRLPTCAYSFFVDNGSRIAGPRCTLRSEVYPFYKGSAMVLLQTKLAAPAPAPAPTAAARGQ